MEILTCTSCRSYRMCKLVFLLCLVKLAVTSESGEDILETLNLIPPALRSIKRTVDPNDDVCFHVLGNYQVNAVPATESKFPWIARVIHSRTANIPHMCTAVCIDEGIFVTAAACIYSLKIKYTSILYASQQLEVRAFVLPSKPTKQMFDDIGIIVVETKDKNVKWTPLKLFTAVNRTDDDFRWMPKLTENYGTKDYKVVGYAIDKGYRRIPSAEAQFNLYELDVIVEHDICYNVLQDYRPVPLEGFRLPCYYTCKSEEYFVVTFPANMTCQTRYLGVEGGALFHTVKKALIGVATWSGGDYFRFELPVGFAFANSDTFYKDLACAKAIRADNGMTAKRGYYQSLCDGKR